MIRSILESVSSFLLSVHHSDVLQLHATFSLCGEQTRRKHTLLVRWQKDTLKISHGNPETHFKPASKFVLSSLCYSSTWILFDRSYSFLRYLIHCTYIFSSKISKHSSSVLHRLYAWQSLANALARQTHRIQHSRADFSKIRSRFQLEFRHF